MKTPGTRPLLIRVKEQVVLAVKYISRELVWKIHFETAQTEERAANCAALGLYNITMKSQVNGLAVARYIMYGYICIYVSTCA